MFDAVVVEDERDVVALLLGSAGRAPPRFVAVPSSRISHVSVTPLANSTRHLPRGCLAAGGTGAPSRAPTASGESSMLHMRAVAIPSAELPEEQPIVILTACQSSAGTITPKVAELPGANSRSAKPVPQYPIGWRRHWPACFNSIWQRGEICPAASGGSNESGV